MVVVLVAVSARQIAAADGNQVRGDRVVLMPERSGEHPGLTESPLRLANAPSQRNEMHVVPSLGHGGSAEHPPDLQF